MSATVTQLRPERERLVVLVLAEVKALQISLDERCVHVWLPTAGVLGRGDSEVEALTDALRQLQVRDSTPPWPAG